MTRIFLKAKLTYCHFKPRKRNSLWIREFEGLVFFFDIYLLYLWKLITLLFSTDITRFHCIYTPVINSVLWLFENLKKCIMGKLETKEPKFRKPGKLPNTTTFVLIFLYLVIKRRLERSFYWHLLPLLLDILAHLI